MKFHRIACAFSFLLVAACSAPVSAPSAAPEHIGHEAAKLSDFGAQIVGAYRVANTVSGQTFWKTIDFMADGTFGAFAPCKVPACTAFRTTGTFDVAADDFGNETLTLTPATGSPLSYALTFGWDGAMGIELANDQGDEQLGYEAGSCESDVDCAGQPALDTTNGSCTSTVVACTVNECQTQCAPVTSNLAARGQHCGGFVANAKKCANGLTCVLGAMPDAGGTCEPVGTPTSCLTDLDCFDGQQSCFTPNGQCGGAGRCTTRQPICPHICGATSVCGCDGQTYCNPCLAQAAGASVASSGACTAN